MKHRAPISLFAALLFAPLFVLPASAQTTRIKIDTVADGLENPWSLAFLPDGRMLVTERTVNGGTLRIIDKGAVSAPVTGTPTVHVQQDAGIGLANHRDWNDVVRL